MSGTLARGGDRAAAPRVRAGGLFLRGLLAAFVVTGGVGLSGSARADFGSASITSITAAPIRVESVGAYYVKTADNAGPIKAKVLINISTETAGRVKSWSIEPRLIYQRAVGGDETLDLPDLGHSQTYSSPRPRVVNTTRDFTIPRLRYMNFAVDACKARADVLRSQGLADAEIFSQDRETAISVATGFDFDNSGPGSNNLPPEATGWNSALTVKLICEASEQYRLRPEVADFVLQENKSLTGECSLRLSGRMQTPQPNTLVRYRYVNTAGNQSDVKVGTSNSQGVLTFMHDYPLPSGLQSGSVRVVGVSDDFNSDWRNYQMECLSGGTKVASGTGRFLLTSEFGDVREGLYNGYVCPVEITAKGEIAYREEVIEGILALRTEQTNVPQKQSQVKEFDFNLRPSMIVSRRNDFSVKWSNVFHAPGTPPKQTLKFSVLLIENNEITKQVDKTIDLECRKPRMQLSHVVNVIGEKRVNHYVCPERAVLEARLSGADPMEGRMIMKAEWLPPAVFEAGQQQVAEQQFQVDPGQIRPFSFEPLVRWQGILPVGGNPPKLRLKATYQIVAGQDVLQEAQEIAELQCRIVESSGPGQPGGGMTLGQENNLPSQQSSSRFGQLGGARQLAAPQQAVVPMRILSPSGRIARMASRHAKIKLAGGEQGASYDLSFYRKTLSGYVKVNGSGIPDQMKGAELQFNARHLTGAREWRLKVCPVGKPAKDCETTTFELSWE